MDKKVYLKLKRKSILYPIILTLSVIVLGVTIILFVMSFIVLQIHQYNVFVITSLLISFIIIIKLAKMYTDNKQNWLNPEELNLYNKYLAQQTEDIKIVNITKNSIINGLLNEGLSYDDKSNEYLQILRNAFIKNQNHVIVYFNILFEVVELECFEYSIINDKYQNFLNEHKDYNYKKIDYGLIELLKVHEVGYIIKFLFIVCENISDKDRIEIKTTYLIENQTLFVPIVIDRKCGIVSYYQPYETLNFLEDFDHLVTKVPVYNYNSFIYSVLNHNS